MNTAEYVTSEIERRKAEKTDLSQAVWETALDCVGWPYVYATAGAECTPSGRKQKARDDHPTIVSACQVLNGKSQYCNGCKWYPTGKRVRMFDCRGFTRWCLAQYGINLQGGGCTSQWNNQDNWVAKGKIADIPDNILVCLFYSKNGQEKTWEHTGFGFNGETVECGSNVQYNTKRNKKWTHWAIPKGIDGRMPDIKPTLRRGSKGEYVTLLQTMLVQRGYDIGACGIDGDFGRGTEAAVKAFQRDNGLTQDGICGRNTWAALDSGDSPSLFTVTVPHMTKYQAEGLVQKYVGAYMTEEGR